MTIAALNRGASKGDITRERIKATARSLFIQYGIEAVTIRDIAKHAGQRNGGSINYYFGSKDELVLEILNEAAEAANEDRARALDALEAGGQPIAVRDILRVLITGEGDGSRERMRLFTMLQIHRRDLMHTEIPGRLDQAYRRCVAHLRKLLPDYPERIFRQRLYFLTPYLWTFLATREGGTERAQFWQQFWDDPSTLESLLDTAEGILTIPPSTATLDALPSSERTGAGLRGASG